MVEISLLASSVEHEVKSPALVVSNRSENFVQYKAGERENNIKTI